MIQKFAFRSQQSSDLFCEVEKNMVELQHQISLPPLDLQ